MRRRTEATGEDSKDRTQELEELRRCRAQIRDRVFLVGPNASGKSNFLDAFRFLRDLASAGGGLQEAVARRSGVSAIRCLAARRYPDVEIAATLQDDGARSTWEYRLSFYQDNQRRAAGAPRKSCVPMTPSSWTGRGTRIGRTQNS